MKDVSLYPDAHLRVFDRPALPDPGDLEDVYLIGICGTGMGSLAGLFRQSGYEVRGSDHAAYPPMSTRLARAGIQVIEGYRAENLEPEPGLVIVGNACVPTHPEAARSRERALAQASFPEALARYFIGRRRSLVIAGTHGKSTTTALLAHVLLKAGVDPGFLIGGVLVDRDTSCSVGSGEYFVVEGDEYDSAYFDKRPKFQHYRPWAAVVTSLEFDHADIYDDFEDYRQAFIEFVRLVPREGLLVLNAHDPSVVALARDAQCRIRKYAVGNDLDDVDIRAVDLRHSPEGVRFRLEAGEDAVEVRFPMAGLHNVQNALAATSLALASGLSLAQAAEGLESFRGLKRRQEIVGEVAGVTVLDDFAHHPTAVRETVRAIRRRWPERRLVSVFEPRSNSSRRKVFEEPYVEAFSAADVALFCRPPFRHNDRPEDFMDVDVIVSNLASRSVLASAFSDADATLDNLTEVVETGDVVLIMSNGGFGGIHGRLLKSLAERSGAPSSI